MVRTDNQKSNATSSTTTISTAAGPSTSTTTSGPPPGSVNVWNLKSTPYFHHTNNNNVPFTLPNTNSSSRSSSSTLNTVPATSVPLPHPLTGPGMPLQIKSMSGTGITRNLTDPLPGASLTSGSGSSVKTKGKTKASSAGQPGTGRRKRMRERSESENVAENGMGADGESVGLGEIDGLGRKKALPMGGIWPCKINGCNKQFAREADLKRHQRTTKMHSMPGFSCPQCDANFTRTDALRRHQKSRHNGIIIDPPDRSDENSNLNEQDGIPDAQSRSRSGTPSSSKGKEKASNIPGHQTTNMYVQTHQGAPTHTGPSSYYRSHTAMTTPHISSTKSPPTWHHFSPPPPQSSRPLPQDSSHPQSSSALPTTVGTIAYIANPAHAGTTPLPATAEPPAMPTNPAYYPSPHYRPHTHTTSPGHHPSAAIYGSNTNGATMITPNAHGMHVQRGTSFVRGQRGDEQSTTIPTSSARDSSAPASLLHAASSSPPGSTLTPQIMRTVTTNGTASPSSTSTTADAVIDPALSNAPHGATGTEPQFTDEDVVAVVHAVLQQAEREREREEREARERERERQAREAVESDRERERMQRSERNVRNGAEMGQRQQENAGPECEDASRRAEDEEMARTRGVRREDNRIRHRHGDIQGSHIAMSTNPNTNSTLPQLAPATNSSLHVLDSDFGGMMDHHLGVNMDIDPIPMDLEIDLDMDALHGYGSSSSSSLNLKRPEPMEHILTEDGEPMLNPAELLTSESLASPPPS